MDPTLTPSMGEFHHLFRGTNGKLETVVQMDNGFYPLLLIDVK